MAPGEARRCSVGEETASIEFSIGFSIGLSIGLSIGFSIGFSGDICAERSVYLRAMANVHKRLLPADSPHMRRLRWILARPSGPGGARAAKLAAGARLGLL